MDNPEFDEAVPNFGKILEEKDFFPKIFLQPSEIKLDRDEGLKVIKRNMNRLDKYEEEAVKDIMIDQTKIKNFNDLYASQNPAGHGLLSLFKKTPDRRIKLAICICVYSEPKFMLKNTIKGIQESYRPFLEKAGILPHEIIIVVVFDGIEKINNSKDQTQNMISFFKEIDIKNGFVQKTYGKSLDEYFKDIQQQNYHLSRLDEDQKDDEWNIFTSEDYAELQPKLFSHQYEEFTRIKQLLSETEKLKKRKHIKLDSLPHQIYKKYEDICYNFCLQNNIYYETQEEIQEYLDNKRAIKDKLIQEALNQTEILCRKSIESRQDKAILYPVRLETDDFLNPKVVEQNPEEKQPLVRRKEKQYNYMFFAVKYKNQGKLSSHMLFFEGFCKLFDPNYCILTDVGMKPTGDAIYRYWEYMELNPRCGGVCGYMNLKIQSASDDLGYRNDGFQKEHLGCCTRCMQCLPFLSVQRAQLFEYHFAHMMDKPFESFFRYIHVLPGAFSGYRWKALKNYPYKHSDEQEMISDQFTERGFNEDEEDEEYQTLMVRYLKIAKKQQPDRMTLEDSNMYLAEDRIMCLGIHALGYDITYLPDVESSVDPVTSLTRLLGQRRRWINGSWFAFNYVWQHCGERTSFIFIFQIIYYRFVQGLQWCAPALFYIAMNLSLVAAVRQYIVPLFLDFFNKDQIYNLADYRISIFNIKNMVQSIPDVINYVYIMLMFSIVLYSILVNHNNLRFKKIYYSASTLFGIYGVLVIVLLVYNTYKIFFGIEAASGDFIIPIVYLRSLILFVVAGHALPILFSFSPRKYVQTLTALPSYIYYIPTYINILQVFAFSRIDDLSWGTKGLDQNGELVLDQQQKKLMKEWEKRKYIFVLQYITCNILLSYIVIKISDYPLVRNYVILISMCLVVFLLIFRLVPALLYLIFYKLKRICGKKINEQEINKNLRNGERILKVLKSIQLRIKELQKIQVTRKKQEQYDKAKAVASQLLLSKSLSNFGNKLKSRVTQNMMKNNVIVSNKQIDPNRKKSKKKISLRRKLKPVQQASIEESEESNRPGKKSGKDKLKSESRDKDNKSGNDPINNDRNGNYNLMIPDSKGEGEIKSRLKAMREKNRKRGQQRKKASEQ